jgi:3D (Asp-Asp-Asp) domain-containing protein
MSQPLLSHTSVEAAAPAGRSGGVTPRRITRGLALSAGILLTVSFLGAAKVHTASRDVKPLTGVKPLMPVAPTVTPRQAPKPVSIPLRVLSTVTSESARGESPAFPLSVMQQPVARLASYRVTNASAELMRDVNSAAGSLASASATGRAPRRIATRMEVTAYCPCTKCCGPLAQGITASGRLVSHNSGKFVAADTGLLRFGTRLEIPGYHGARAVEVIDRGGAIKGHKLDVYFPTHEEALLWGRKMLDVNVVE